MSDGEGSMAKGPRRRVNRVEKAVSALPYARLVRAPVPTIDVRGKTSPAKAGKALSRRFTAHRGRAYPAPRVAVTQGIEMAGNPLAAAFTACRSTLLRYLHARGAGEDAEDLLQDLWLKLDGVEVGRVDDVRAYLYRMAHNLMLDRRRSVVRARARDDAYQREEHERIDHGSNAERMLLAREKLLHVDRALAGLGSRTDFIFRRFRVDGIAQREIAAELGITLSAVEKHLQKAYRAVAEAQRTYVGESDAVETANEPR